MDDIRDKLKESFDDRVREKLSDEELANVQGGGSWFNAPDAPECPYCGSHDTFTVGCFLMWNGFCRSCEQTFTESTASRIH